MPKDIQPAIDCLNSALESDPDAIRSLFGNMVRCNQQLADHPNIPVASNDAANQVGTLGIVNGVLQSLGFPMLARMTDEFGEIIGFCPFVHARRFAIAAAEEPNESPGLGCSGMTQPQAMQQEPPNAPAIPETPAPEEPASAPQAAAEEAPAADPDAT